MTKRERVAAALTRKPIDRPPPGPRLHQGHVERRVLRCQQVDIYATRDRLGWVQRADQWMLFHDATLR